MLVLVTSILALSACVKEEVYRPIDNAEEFTLSVSQEGDDETKAAINSSKSTEIVWSYSDKLNYFGTKTGQYMSIDSGVGTTSAVFKGAISQGSNDYVLYPYQSDASISSGTITATIPSQQVVPAGSFDPKAGLMVGKVSGTSVKLYNAVAYIAITIPSGMTGITKMVITGNADERLSGKVTISNIKTDAEPTIKGTQRTWSSDGLSVESDGVKYVEVTPVGGGTFIPGSTYYVAVAPDAVMASGIYVLLYNGSMTFPESLKLAAKKSAKSLGIARNKVIKMTLPSVSKWYDMVKLDNGLYMAPFNIGATSTSESGNKYRFGNVDTGSTSYCKGNTLEGATDAATSNWGSDWKMITKSQAKSNTSTLKSNLYSLTTSNYWTSEYPCHISLTRVATTVSISVVESSTTNIRTKEYFVCPILGESTNLMASRFSVGSGQTVQFTKGNLYWNGSAFKFETSQEGRVSTRNSGHISHFFWSKTAEGAYASSLTETKAKTDVFFADYSKKITVEGESDLFVLSQTQWNYLINNRDGSRFAKARVNKTPGMILFPDNYQGTTSGTGIATVNKATASIPSNSIDSNTWAVMQSSGVVFLPCTSLYKDNAVDSNYYDTHLYYWSSSPFNTSTSTVTNPQNDAMALSCDSNNINTNALVPRSQGCAIRLVKVIN